MPNETYGKYWKPINQMEASLTFEPDTTPEFNTLKTRIETLGDVETLNQKYIPLLKRINTLAAKNNCNLSHQSDTVILALLEEVEKNSDDTEQNSNAIYATVNSEIIKNDEITRRHHAQQSHLGIIPLHLTDVKKTVEMHDQDMIRVMPKSCGNTEVLAPLNINDPGSVKAVKDGIKAAITNNQLAHIIIPIGPDHWRGLYLTKPIEADEPYSLEIYDSFGQNSAKTIEAFTLKCLDACGLKLIDIVYPKIDASKHQTDSYSCGDFVCAYSHKKMQEFNVDKQGYDPELIIALDKGNANGSLRNATREVSKKQYDTILSNIPALATEKTRDFPKNKEEFSHRLMETSVLSEIHKAWDLQVVDHENNGYIIQSNLKGRPHQRDRDVTVSKEKVSAVLTEKPDAAYMTYMAEVMVYAAITAGKDLARIKINSENKEMKLALEKEISKHLPQSEEKNEEEISLSTTPKP